MDLAKLGLAVDANNAIIALDRTGKKLDEVGAAGTRVEQSTNRVSRELEAMSRQATQAEQSTGRVGREINNSSAAANRLLGALSPLTAQMTGMNGAALNVARAIGMIELSSTALVGALASVAVAGAVWRLWTKDIRELHDEIEKTIAAQRELNDQRAFGAKLPLLQANADMAAQAEFLREQIAYKEKWGGYLVGGANDPKVMRAELNALTASINENKKALLELEPVNEMFDGDLAARTREILNEAKARREAALAVAEYTRQLGNLNILLDAANRDVPSTMDVQLGLGSRGFGGVPGRSGPASYYRDMSGIMRQDPSTLGRINGPVPLAASYGSGGTNWAAAGQIAGGMILGTGLAGDGYLAAGLSGGMNMAAQGAMLGSVVPGIGTAVGAVVGGVAGLVSGLIGHGKAAKEAAEQLKAAQRVFDADIAARRAAAGGDTRLAEDLRMQAQFEREIAEARKAGMNGGSIKALQAVQYEEKLAVARQREADAAKTLAEHMERVRSSMGDLTSSIARTLGQNDFADSLDLAERQRGRRASWAAEMAPFGGLSSMQSGRLSAAEAIETDILGMRQALEKNIAAVEAAADAQLAALADQMEVAQAQLRVAQDELRAQEQTVTAMRQVVTSLTEYGRGLLTGSFSTLSPFGQLTSARSQFGGLVSLAMGGDLTAAQSLPSAGNTLLSASRGYNASGAGYVGDFKLVQDAIDLVRGKYANQLTVEEKILAELQRQSASLQQQISELQNNQRAVRESADEQIKKYHEEFISSSNKLWEMWKELVGINSKTIDHHELTYVDPNDPNSSHYNPPPPYAPPPPGQGGNTTPPNENDPNSDPWGSANVAGVLFEGFNALAQRLESVEVAVREGTSQTSHSLEGVSVNARSIYDEG